MNGAPPRDGSPAIQDAAHAVRLAVRWRKPLLGMLAGMGGLVLSASGYYVHHLLAVDGWERVAAAQKTQGDKLADHDRRLVVAEQMQAVWIAERRAFEERERARDERDKKRDEKLDLLLEGFAWLKGRFEGRSHYQEEDDARRQRDVARDAPRRPRANRR